MKLLFCIASIFLLQSVICDDGGVANTKRCEDFLSADTCTSLRNLATKLNEKATIVRDAVQAAIKHHKTKATEMLAFIKQYMADNLKCDKVLPADMCKKIFDLGNRVKLTASQIRLAIENAIAKGAATAKDIYNSAVEFMTTQITCANIFSATACDNMKQAIQKFHEQTKLLNEAIMSAAIKNYNNVKDMLTSVKNTIVEKAVNFKCEDALPGTICTKLRDVATNLKLNAQQLKEAIENAIVNGAATAKDIYDKTIVFLTTKINCNGILGEKACNNLVEATKRLKEQTRLVKEAIMSAVLKHYNNAKDILKSVKDTLVEKATNFDCTDALTQQQCDFLTNLAQKFKLKASQLHEVIVGAIVNGANTAAQIYKLTIGSLIETAKNVKCEDLISGTMCSALDAFAQNFNIKVQEVTLAVKTAVANGINTASAIYNFVKQYIIDLVSCENFPGLIQGVCSKLQSLANRLHVSFHKVIKKIAELFASGVTGTIELTKKVTKYIWGLFFGSESKRSINIGGSLTDKIVNYVQMAISLAKGQLDSLRNEINEGKVTIFNFLTYVKQLIAKYGPQSDEVLQSDEVKKSLIEQLKEALKKAHGAAKQKIRDLLTKSKEQLEKLKEYIKQVLGKQDQTDGALDLTHEIYSDILYQELDEELKNAENEVKMMEDMY